MINHWKFLPLCASLNPKVIGNYQILDDFECSEDDIIEHDSKRTRVGLANSLDPEELKNFIRLYCKELGIKYKQGMNEVAAPFLLMKEQDVSISVAYECFKIFVKKCLPGIFQDEVHFN